MQENITVILTRRMPFVSLHCNNCIIMHGMENVSNKSEHKSPLLYFIHFYHTLLIFIFCICNFLSETVCFYHFYFVLQNVDMSQVPTH